MTSSSLPTSPQRVLGSLVVAACLAATPALRAGAEGFEEPPTLSLQDTAPVSLYQGPGFRVNESVPTDGLTTHFTIESDAGTFYALGVETLALRSSEVPAIAELDRTSKTETFAKAMGSTAVKPVKSAAHLVAHPVSSAKGLPGGVHRLFSRVGTGTEQIAATAMDSDEAAGERTEKVAKQSGAVGANALGYNLELRKLAKQLNVDPYTSNPQLAEKLHQFATVAFEGHFATNVVISVVVPASIVLTGTNVTRDLIYDTPKGDLMTRNVEAMKAMGATEADIQGLRGAKGFSLSLETALVEWLSHMENAEGRTEVLRFAAGAQTPDEALHVTRAVRMLAKHQGMASIARLEAPRGTVLGYEADGSLILPAPLDYVSWTEQVAAFASRSDLVAPKRTVWITGRMSPKAMEGFEELGWRISEGVGRSW